MDSKVITAYHFPRWADLPDLSLYMDQVRTILDEALKAFVPDAGNTVTSTMINNYVKMKIISPPEQKKYRKEHVCLLIFLSVFKRVLSMNEIAILIRELQKQCTVPELYDMFCDELEKRLRETVEDETTAAPSACPEILTAATRALAGKLVFEAMVSMAAAPQSENPHEKPDKTQVKPDKKGKD